jgi:P-type Cu+ transporter
MNFGWAMVYNLVLIPLSAGAFYPLNGTRIPPVWSALAMALSRQVSIFLPLFLSDIPKLVSASFSAV